MTGIPPADLLGDEDLYTAAVEQAGIAEWSQLHELVAQNTEVTHSLLRVVLNGLGAKEQDIPEPLHYPRPGAKRPEKVVLSGLDAARAIMGGG